VVHKTVHKKNNLMIVVSSREFRDNQKKFFDLAEVQRVIIKRKNQFLELVPRGDIIPESVSPSNDPYFDDPRNIEHIEKGLEQAKQGKTVKLTTSLREELFGNV
jgi:antitoxin YefM